MKLLWVEDDMLPIVHHKADILAKRWTYTIVKTLFEAFQTLQSGEENWDMVLIDLNIPLGASPLPQALVALNAMDAHSDVLGRLLGLWLWEKAGRRCKATGPMHAYFTTVPDRYEVYVGRSPVEFASGDGKPHTKYVLNKWEGKSLSDELEELVKAWPNDFSTQP
jgi:hypothetical protein